MLEEDVNIEDVVDCKIILVERMTTSGNEKIHCTIETSNDQSETPNIKSDCDFVFVSNNANTESVIDLTGDDSDVDDVNESGNIQDKVKDEEKSGEMDDGIGDCNYISTADSSTESSLQQESVSTNHIETMDHKSNVKSEESKNSGNKCSESLDNNRSSVNDVLQQKYAGVDVINIEDSDDESDIESYQSSSLPCSTEKNNHDISQKSDCIEILSDSEHRSENKEEEVKFIMVTKSKHALEQGSAKLKAERLFKRQRQDSRAAFAKVSSQSKISHTRIKYSIPSNETQRAARLNEEKERSQKNERYEFNEVDYEEQERLFRESAARVKAQEIAQQRFLQSMEGIHFFSKPADVTSLPPNHWKWSDPYSRLGVPKQCSVEIARKNYKKLCLIYHPDKAKKDSSLQFQAIKEAWETISSQKH